MVNQYDCDTETARLIDPAMSAEIVRELGEDFVLELCEGLDLEAEEGFGQLHAAVRSQDAGAIQQCLHGLRGAGLNLGFTVFAARAHDLEEAATTGAVPSVATVGELHALFTTSIEAVRQRLQTEYDQAAA